MLRLLTIALVLFMLILGASACGSGQDDQAMATEPPAPAAQTDEPTEATTEATTKAEVEDVLEEDATTVAETEATVEAAEEAAATEALQAATVAEEVAGEAEAVVAPLIQVTSETFIGDVIDSNNPTHVTLSTSGRQLVWPQAEGRFWNREGELCTYTFESAATECAIAPDAFHGYPYAFFWSAGDDYVAFTENPIQQGNESDIWIFEPASQTYTNLTDDGVEGDWFGAEPGSYALDYLPMWNQQNDDIYFWRSIPNPDYPISLTLSIMRVTPQGGDPELVRDLQDIRGGELVWFNDEEWYMDGVSALAPDGRHVAVLAVSENVETGINQSDGLWLVNLVEESAPPRHLVTAEEFQMAIPDWSTIPLIPSGLSWAASGDRLVVLAQNKDIQMPVVVLYDVDVATGALTPVVDFSALPDGEAYTTPPDEIGLAPRMYSPWTASLSPDNDVLLMYQNLAGVAGLMASPLPPTGDLPGLDYASDLQDAMPTPRSSRGNDGKVLIYNILFNLAPP